MLRLFGGVINYLFFYFSSGRTNGEHATVDGTKSKPLSVDEDRNTPSPCIIVEDELTPEEKEAARRREQEEEARKKALFEKKEQEMILKILEYQRTNAIYPIGRDRMYRRYWLFHSLPGLFVEDNELFVPDEVINPVLQNPDSKSSLKTESSIPVLTAAEENNTSTSSDKENQAVEMPGDANPSPENSANNAGGGGGGGGGGGTGDVAVNRRLEVLKKSDDELIVISDSESDSQGLKDASASKMGVDGACHKFEIPDPPKLEAEAPPPRLEAEPPLPVRDTEITRQIRQRPCVKWLFVSEMDMVDRLVHSLNSRGFRESGLKQALTDLKAVLNKLMKNCPVGDLTLPPDAVEEARVKALSMTRGILGKKAAMGTVKNDSAEETLELNLRDMLLDLEDRIYAGALGLVKVIMHVKELKTASSLCCLNIFDRYILVLTYHLSDTR